MVTETHVSVDDLIMPLFVCPGENVNNPISSMPGNSQLSIDNLVKECKSIYALGVKSVLLFGIPEHKDEDGSVACEDNAIVQRAIRAIKMELPDMFIVADVCNCEYTTHGHCGPIVDNDVDNDKTLVILAKQSVSLAKAGADLIAPSDMMDGRIAAIRKALDENGYYKIPIMSYAAKYASAIYGPFRDALNSSPKKGDKKTYQMDYANVREALREAYLDESEGADILMIKPGLPYLDVIKTLRDNTTLPIAAYNVSGEYAMVKAAADKGWIDGEKVMIEMLWSFKRAGTDMILTYFAKEAARVLNR
jgi:porphobilinogen synthase